jgi:Zn-dependent protease
MNGLFDTGYWTPGRVMGTPVRLHWSIPVGAFVFGRFAFVPGFWLGFFLLVLVHELGHAFLVKTRGLHNHEVRVHGLGGVSIHEAGSRWDQAIIAWGGVLAQILVLYVPTKLIVELVPLPPSTFMLQLLSAFLYTNLVLAAFNLIPIAPFDGAKAWQLPKMWWRRRKADRRSREAAARRKQAKPKGADAASGANGPNTASAARDIARKALEDARRK